ncbi:hypothetical protein Nmel_017901 [Mimus melanotis]
MLHQPPGREMGWGRTSPPRAGGGKQGSPRALPWCPGLNPSPPISQAEGPCRMSMLASSQCWPSRQPSSPLTPLTHPWCAWSLTMGTS